MVPRSVFENSSICHGNPDPIVDDESISKERDRRGIPSYLKSTLGSPWCSEIISREGRLLAISSRRLDVPRVVGG